MILFCAACHVDTSNDTGSIGTTGATQDSVGAPEGSVPEVPKCPIHFAPFEDVGNDPNNLSASNGGDIAFDITYTYFSGSSAFYRIPRTGGNPEQICDHYLSSPNVYRRNLYGIFDGKIVCIDLKTGEEQVLFDQKPVANKEIAGVSYFLVYRISGLYIVNNMLFFCTVEDYWEASDDCMVQTSGDFCCAIHAIDLSTGQWFKDLYVDEEGGYSQDDFLFASGEDDVYAINTHGEILWIALDALCEGAAMQKLPSFTEKGVDGIYFGHNGFIAMTGNGAEYRAYLYEKFHNAKGSTYYGTTFLDLGNNIDWSFIKGSRAVIGGNLVCERGDGMLHMYDGISYEDRTEPLFATESPNMLGVYKNQLYYLQLSADGDFNKMIVVNSDGTYKEYSNS